MFTFFNFYLYVNIFTVSRTPGLLNVAGRHPVDGKQLDLLNVYFLIRHVTVVQGTLHYFYPQLRCQDCLQADHVQGIKDAAMQLLASTHIPTCFVALDEKIQHLFRGDQKRTVSKGQDWVSGAYVFKVYYLHSCCFNYFAALVLHKKQCTCLYRLTLS